MSDDGRKHAPPTFVTECRYEVQGRGSAYVVVLDRDTDDFSHLIGRSVLLDGHPYKVTGVERFLHSPPWKAGEKIGLLACPDEARQ